jgi:hypothetical protein
MMPPPIAASRLSAVESWSPQSQRRGPKASPVRQAECRRTGVGSDKSSAPMITATDDSPTESRNTTKRVRIPDASGTSASPAIDSERARSS